MVTEQQAINKFEELQAKVANLQDQVARQQSETREILRSTLEILQAQVNYTKKIHGWIGALAAYQIGGDDPLKTLEGQPLFDQGRDPFLRILESDAESIGALLQRLIDQK